MRADQLLVHRGLAASRSQAQRLIDAGVRALSREGWKMVSKSDELHENAELELLDTQPIRYVSRGGLKLEGALRQAGIDVRGLLCLDIGQSTGGFTDCLLQHGAAHVVGVDVGHGQLHMRLRSDEHVLCIEGFNARQLGDDQALSSAVEDAIHSVASHAHSKGAKSRFDAQKIAFDLVVGDLSFISQTLIVPCLPRVLRAGAQVLMLVKPQFELQPSDLGKGGIVRDASLYAQVQQRICDAYAQAGLAVKHYFESPIEGADGNREFFVHAVSKQGENFHERESSKFG